MGIVERRIRDKERRVGEILGAAKTLFIDKGYMNTTMLDIAEQAELSRRTIYLYFTSKEEITLRVILSSFRFIHKAISEACEPEMTGLEQVIAMRDAYMKIYHEDFDHVYFTLFYDFKLSTETMKDEDAQACNYVIEQIVQVFTESLQKGVVDGTIHIEGDLRVRAFTAMTIIHSTMQKVASRQEIIDNMANIDGELLIQTMFAMLLTSFTLKQ